VGKDRLVGETISEKLWEFTLKNVKEGDLVTGGDIVGVIRENGLLRNHYVMVHPGTSGRVKKVLPAETYPVETIVVKVEEAGKVTGVQLFQRWPVCEARPVVEKLQGVVALAESMVVEPVSELCSVKRKIASPRGAGSM